VLAAGLSLRHGWAGLTGTLSPAAKKMLQSLGVDPATLSGVSWLNLLVAGLLLFPPTFFADNLLIASIILLLIAYVLCAGHLAMALVEVPFLILPFILIWLGYPFAR
jgi:hypothetical protein